MKDFNRLSKTEPFFPSTWDEELSLQLWSEMVLMVQWPSYQTPSRDIGRAVTVMILECIKSQGMTAFSN